MRKILLIIVAGLLLSITRDALAQAGEFSISDFKADLTIQEDGSLIIKEQIQGDFLTDSREFVRYVPIKAVIDNQLEVETDISVLSVRTSEKTDVPYTAEINEDTYVIKIGNTEQVGFSSFEYIIEYEALGVFTYFDDHDELNWSVTGGNQFTKNSEVATIIHLPPSAFMTGNACFSEIDASVKSKCQVKDMGTKIEFLANEYFTVALGFTPNIIAEVKPRIIDRAETVRLQAEARAEQEQRSRLKQIYNKAILYGSVFFSLIIIGTILIITRKQKSTNV